MSVYAKLLRSLTKSTETPVKAAVKGEIPKWLNGTLYRNGAGRYEFGFDTYLHFFDGHACVHKFKVQDGDVFYSNRLLETGAYNQTINEKRLYPAFGTSDKKANIFERIKNLSSLKIDNVNVNVVPYAHDHLYALTETNMYCKLDPKDLKIIDTINISEYMPTVRSTIAHPHVENDGSWITMGMNLKGKRPHYEFIKYAGGEKGAKAKNPAEQAKIIASIPSRDKNGYSYFHSFGLTENYIVFLEQCSVLNVNQFLLGILKNKPISSAFKTEKNLPSKIHIINKHTGEVVSQQYVTDPQFTFHYINSYESGKDIILDLCSYDANHFDIAGFTYNDIRSGKLNGNPMVRSIAKRVKIPLDKKDPNKEIHCEIKDINSKLVFEFPIINYSKHNGRPYKYVYGANVIYDKICSITKLNVENPSEFYELKYQKNGINYLPQEPIFVESPNPTSEDDGVLLVMVLSEKNDFLSILDAKNLKELARAELPEDVKGTFALHGFFADSQTFKNLN